MSYDGTPFAPPPNFFQPHTALQISGHTDADSATARSLQPPAATDRPAPHDWRIHQVIAILTTDLGHAHTVEELAARVGLSASRLAHLFKAETGLPPWQYLVQLRLHAALELLATTSLSVKEIMHRVGVCDRSYFNRLIRKRCRHSPAHTGSSGGQNHFNPQQDCPENSRIIQLPSRQMS
ncbi:MAG TPA: AraC family transcriptional regulator [Blastocatellia bacterium]|nr:AraC family transcriptional regulator [Blastocatellia bacterium]